VRSMKMGGSPFGISRPGKALTGLLAANFVVYVLELILLRLGVSWVPTLALTPDDVFQRGYLWQPLSYMWLHDPGAPMHLLFNLFVLWMFGGRLESWWGHRRFLLAYLFFGLMGGGLTLLVAAMFSSLSPALHWGASGAVSGVIVAWGLVFADEEMEFLLLGRITGRKFVLLVVGVQLLYALSLSPISSTSHFGGMIGAAILCRGLWRPSRWRESFRQLRLRYRRHRIESTLRVIDGQKGTEKKKPLSRDGTPPGGWN
jgi:membrane associated rhomboid family serine protease